MEAQLHWLDYLLFAIFLLVSIGIGVYHACTGGKQGTTSEFLLDNRKLKVIPTMISLLVSFQSAIMILGNTAEMYTRGVQVWVVSMFAYVLAILLVERLIVPWIYPMKLTSIFEYLEMRYKSKIVRTMGAAYGIISGVMYMGIAMFAPSIALEAATGLSVYWGVPLMALVCTIYTSVGGMRAVIWTDVFQFGVMVVGMIGVLIKGNMAVGGFGRAMDLAGKEGRLIYIDWNLDPRVRHTFWGLSMAQIVGWAQVYGINQASVQRFTSTRTEREARLILLSNIPPLIVMKSVACMIGVTVLAYASQIQCDPIASGEISNSNQLLPWFVMRIFGDARGFAGVFLATLYSGALSSVSSSLSACSAIMWSNVIKPHFDVSRLTDGQAALINKLTVVVFGVLACGISFIAINIPGPITQISGIMFGSIGGPKLAVFVLGGFFKTTEWIGVLTGCICSMMFMMWLCIGGRQMAPGHQPPLPPVSTDNCSVPSSNYTATTTHNFYTTVSSVFNNETSLPPEVGPDGRALHGLENLYGISYIWYTIIGLFIAAVVALTVSAIVRCITKEDADDVPDDLMIPFRKFFSIECFRSTEEADELKKSSYKENISPTEVEQVNHLLNGKEKC